MSANEPSDLDLRKELGLPNEKTYRFEPAPRQVDVDLLRRFHADRLPRDLELEIRALTLTYREWAMASQTVLLEIVAASIAGEKPLDQQNSAPEMPALPSWVEKAMEYAGMSFRELMAELPTFAPAYRSDPLAAYRQVLRVAVCGNWNWIGRKAAFKDVDKVKLIVALAEHLLEAKIQMPFPPELVAAILVKEGLDDFCKGDI